jgi:hypothetical protein
VSDSEQGTQQLNLVHSARFGSGLGTVYHALDLLLATRGHDDAALVVDVPVLGRQVLRAGRRPLRDDDHGLLGREPGLYVGPTDDGGFDAVDEPLVQELMVALAELGLRHDTAALDVRDRGHA